MQTRSFDPSRALRFDLPRGSVHSASDERMLLLPVDALNELFQAAAPGVVEALGERIGRSFGQRIVARFGSIDEVRQAPLETFISQLAGELAVSGFGIAHLERWGRAMVIAIEEAAVSDHLLASVIDTAVETASGREVWCTPIMRDEQTARFFMSSQSAVFRVRQWIDDGMPWGAALSRLHERRVHGEDS